MYKHNRGMLTNVFNGMLTKNTPSHNNETTYSFQNHIIKLTPDKTHLLMLVPNCGMLLSLRIIIVEDCTCMNKTQTIKQNIWRTY